MKVVDLGGETGEEIEEKVRIRMKVDKGMGLCVICKGRRLSWGFRGIGRWEDCRSDGVVERRNG